MAPQQQEGPCGLQRFSTRWLALGLAGLAGVVVVAETAMRIAPASGPSSQFGSTEPRRLAVPDTVMRAFELVADGAREELVRGAREGARPQSQWKVGQNFEAVQISLPLAPPIIKHDPAKGDGEGDKNIVGLQTLGKRGGRRCVVYGMGIAWESHFEEQMAREGCETHAFDCTVDPASPVVAGKSFTFHNWCIGEQGAGFNAGNGYLRGKQGGVQFKKLSETMRLLGHDSVDVLKFDIEGFEWKLFESEILGLKTLPRQLAFELHTEGSKPIAVPPHLVQGRGYVEVNRLFLALHDAGYRVVSKEMNEVDEKCAEFVLANVNEPSA